MSAPDKSKESSESQTDEDSSASDAERLKSKEREDAAVLQDEPEGDDPGSDAPEGEKAEKSADSSSDESPEADRETDDAPRDDQPGEALEADGTDGADSASGPASGEDTLTGSDGADVSAPWEQNSEGTRTEVPGAIPDTPDTPRTVERETVVRKGGFVPMVLGGAVAAVLGFLAAPALQDSLPFLAPPENPFEAETEAALAEQSDALAGLENRLDTVDEAVDAIDLSGVETAVGDVSARVDTLEARLSDLQGQLDGFAGRLDGFEGRITELEKEPMTEAVSPEAIAAYERELEALQAAVEAQRAEIETIAAEAVAAEQSANVEAEKARARAALAQLTAALQNGDPFADYVGQLSRSGLDVPDPLETAAEDGVTTLTALSAEFPDLAREALAAARNAPDTPVDEGLGAFLQRQLNARSVTPREGDSTDAILSRAEAALNEGDLARTLQELSALPDAAKAPFADWIDRAEARQAAMNGAARVATELNQE